VFFKPANWLGKHKRKHASVLVEFTAIRARLISFSFIYDIHLSGYELTLLGGSLNGEKNSSFSMTMDSYVFINMAQRLISKYHYVITALFVSRTTLQSELTMIQLRPL